MVRSHAAAGRSSAMVTAVGSGLGQRLHDVERATDALLEGGVWVITQGSEGDCAWWEVTADEVDRGVRLVHEALVPKTNGAAGQ